MTDPDPQPGETIFEWAARRQFPTAEHRRQAAQLRDELAARADQQQAAARAVIAAADAEAWPDPDDVRALVRRLLQHPTDAHAYANALGWANAVQAREYFWIDTS